MRLNRPIATAIALLSSILAFVKTDAIFSYDISISTWLVNEARTFATLFATSSSYCKSHVCSRTQLVTSSGCTSDSFRFFALAIAAAMAELTYNGKWCAWTLYHACDEGYISIRPLQHSLISLSKRQQHISMNKPYTFNNSCLK